MDLSSFFFKAATVLAFKLYMHVYTYMYANPCTIFNKKIPLLSVIYLSLLLDDFLSWKPKKDIVRTYIPGDIHMYVRTMSAQHLTKDMCLTRCCADIVQTLCGHSSDIYLLGYMSAQCPHLILLRFSALVTILANKTIFLANIFVIQRVF